MQVLKKGIPPIVTIDISEVTRQIEVNYARSQIPPMRHVLLALPTGKRLCIGVGFGHKTLTSPNV
jgi:hypothetical protein